MTDRETNDDELIWRVAEALAASEASDEELAERLGVPLSDVTRCRRAHEALGDLGESAFFFEIDGGSEDAPPPQLSADLELTDELGRGGMGIVYRARQRSLDRELAVKVLLPGEAQLAAALRRFKTEARALAKLLHRHIVSIHEVGEADGRVYYTMDLIEGGSLGERLKEGPMAPTRAVRLLRQVASAIACSHEHGIVHRDLKPGNILLDGDGDACVTDFGLAFDQVAGDQLTISGQLLGTPAYMSPEQARGDRRAVGERTDVHALGAILYECLTGVRPFSGGSPIEVLQSIVHDDPKPPRRHDGRIPADLEVIVMKALAKEPARRYATAKAMLEDLERFEDGRPILARAPSFSYRARRLLMRHRHAVTAGMAAATVVSVLIFNIAISLGRHRDLQQADDLRRRGEHAAAAPLYEDGIRRLRAEGEDVPDGVLRDASRCRLEAATTERRAGRMLGSSARLERSIRLHAECGSRHHMPALRWELACTHLMEGEADRAEAELANVVGALLTHPYDVRAPVLRLGAHPILVELMDRLAPDLADPSMPRHGLAFDLTRRILSSGSSHAGGCVQWFTRRALDHPGIIPAIVRMTEGDLTAGLLGRLLEIVECHRLPQWRPALVAIARGDDSLEVRQCAADLLVEWLDLPFWPRRPGATDHASVAAAAETLGDARGPDAWRRRMEIARDRPLMSDTVRERLARWVNRRAGSDLDARSDFTVELNRILADASSVRERLLRAAGLGASASTDEILDALAVADRDRAVVLDTALRLSVEVDTPPARARGRRHAWNHANAWRHAITGRAVPSRLHLLTVRIPRPGDVPELLSSEERPIGSGVVAGVVDTFEAPPAADVTWGWGLPGDPERFVGSESERVHHEVAVRATPRAGAVFVKRARHVTRTHTTGGSSSSGATHRQQAIGVFSIAGADMGQDADLSAIVSMGLCTVAGEEAPATVEAWRQRIVDDLRTSAERAAAGSMEHRAQVREHVRSLVELAAWIPLPEARAVLERLDAEGEGMRRHLFRARLLAGDTAILQEPTHDERAREVVTRSGAAGWWLWTAVARLHRSSPLGEEARRRLDDTVLTPAMVDYLDDEVEHGRYEVDPFSGSSEAELSARAALFTTSGMLALCALFLVLTLASWRRPARYPVAAIGLLATGLLMAAGHVRLGGVDLLPDFLGCALAALAVWRLAHPRDMLQGATVALLLAAAAALLLGPAGWGAWLSVVGATAFVVSIVMLPWLIPDSRRRRPLVRSVQAVSLLGLATPALGVLTGIFVPDGFMGHLASVSNRVPNSGYVMFAILLATIFVVTARSTALETRTRRPRRAR